MKVVPDKFEKNSPGLVRLNIGFLTAEIPSQSDTENYITRGHINFLLTLPKDANNQTFPEGTRKFKNINAEQHLDWLLWTQLKELLYCFPCQLFWNVVCCRLGAFKSALATVEGWPARAKCGNYVTGFLSMTRGMV